MSTMMTETYISCIVAAMIANTRYAWKEDIRSYAIGLACLELSLE